MLKSDLERTIGLRFGIGSGANFGEGENKKISLKCFICGPLLMIVDAETFLLEMNFPRDRILFEKWR